VLAIGVVTLSQRRLQEKEGRWLKLLSGLVMIGLGIYLIVAPYWLNS
jgi:arginine exporter protein ArgO